MEPTTDLRDDPLARIGRRLIAGEQQLRWRRTRRRIAGGALAGALLVVATVALALPGDGGGGRTLARDGGMRLELRVAAVGSGGGGVSAASIAERAQARLAGFGFDDATVDDDGERLTVELPGATPAQAVRARAALDPGRLAFYDWEESVVASDGRAVAAGLAARQRESVRLSQGAGDPSQGLLRPQAERRLAELAEPAALVEAVAPDRLRPSPDDVNVDGEPGREVARTLRELPPSLGERARAAASSERAQAMRALPPATLWYVLRGEPLLTGADVLDPVAGVNDLGQPDVEFRLTPAGQRAFHALTRGVAQRGQSLALPGVEPQSVMQHFAIVLDDRLLSVASIDHQRHPDGIDGRRGAIVEGGFTRRSAEDLAALLRVGALPPLEELSARRVEPVE